MSGRWILRLALFSTWGALTAILGCSNSNTPQRAEEIPATYPLRTGWLVAGQPQAAPVAWPEPGETPLLLLKEPFDQLKGNAARLAADVKTGTLLDTDTMKHHEENPRPLIEKALNHYFGTPGAPTVGLTAEQFTSLLNSREAAIKAAKADEKEFLQEDYKAWQKRQTQNEGMAKAINELKLDNQTLQTGAGLFRNFCIQCHGLTGDGNGPGGRFLNPLPRDYRQGLFKFLTTEPSDTGVRPRRADLIRTIHQGLDGSSMPSFAALKNEQIEALTSYVIHLSLRGECEYLIFKVAADKKKADDFIPSEIEATTFDHLARLLEIWRRSNETPFVAEADPYTTPEEKLKAAARGHKVFLDASQGGCAACHINYGRTAPLQFDSWGGIVRPRNLTLATFRVSRDMDDLYARLYCGIPGVNMPSHKHLRATEDDKAKNQNRLWDAIYFIRAISDPLQRRELQEKYGISLD
jgi:mono/diheme cytochrome c family protein